MCLTLRQNRNVEKTLLLGVSALTLTRFGISACSEAIDDAMKSFLDRCRAEIDDESQLELFQP
jgi:hypothetical protein